jgi:hypothetical protein
MGVPVTDRGGRALALPSEYESYRNFTHSSSSTWEPDQVGITMTETMTQGITLTELEERTRQFLIERARAGKVTSPSKSLITYTGLRDEIDPYEQYWPGQRCTGVGDALDNINHYEHQHGRPMLSALVVLAGEGYPGDGFAKLARNLGHNVPEDIEHTFWRIQVSTVIRYWNAN